MLRFKKVAVLPLFVSEERDIQEYRELGGNFTRKIPKYTGSQAPCTELDRDIIRVFFSARDQYKRSYPFYYEIDEDFKVVKTCDKPLLQLGGPGEGDEDGCMISQVTPAFVNYTGWNKGKAFGIARYRTCCMSADRFSKLAWKKVPGPFLDRDGNSPCGNSMPFETEDTTYYMSYKKWDDVGEPHYNILIAEESEYCCRIDAEYQQLKLREDEGGLCRPVPFRYNNKKYLIYSRRGTTDYRTNKEEAYKIGLAVKSRSGKWSRIDDEIELIGEENSLMQCYFYPQWIKKELFLFYNNDFCSPIHIAKLMQ